ncbi:APC family permease [Sphingomonas sp. TX0543]|uniref:APC family permease n=1 Tax=unclassified Sphingomonas TaxID=196159 RepID=UPI0010F618CD|nr:APC family permease [Sphingomonas sp. 3P27F8]
MPFGLAVVLGGSIGSGILRTPGPVAAALPNPRLLILLWLFGGVLAFIEALPLIELATALPRTGGAIVYVERAFGHIAGTLAGWCSWLQCVISLAFMAVVFAEFAQRLGTHAPVGLMAVGLIVTITALNLSDTRTSGWGQMIGAVVKLLGLLALIALLFAVPPAPQVSHPPGSALSLGGAVIALLLVNNTYQGWSALVPFVEEMRDPTRTMARAMFVGLAIITVIYVGMNVALLRALPFATLAHSTLPAGDAMARVVGPLADRVITALSLISVVAIANLTTMLPARILLAMARARSAPAVFGRIGSNGSPYAATLAVGLVAGVLASSGAYIALNAMYAPLAILTTIAVMLAAWRLRRTEPTLPRPVRMPGHPVPVVVALTVNIAMLVAFVATSPLEALGSVGLVALGMPLLLLSQRKQSGG